MSNIRSNHRQNLRLHCDNSEYWDFFVDKTDVGAYDFGDGDDLYDKCLISYIDFSNPSCIEDGNAVSVSGYSWDGAVNTGHTFENIGYTGVDNGMIRFRKDMVTNDEFFDIYTKSRYSTEEGDMRLRLNSVSGNTMEHSYPMEYDEKGGYFSLKGGYFQGFFMDYCDTYQILPEKLDDTWHLEFEIRPMDYEEPENSVNSKHPENKGIFFYMGIRGENKWYKEYNCRPVCSEKSASNYVDGSYIDDDEYILGEFSGDMTPTYGSDMDFSDDDIVDYVDLDDESDEYEHKSCGGDCDYIAEETDLTKKEFTTSDGLTIGVNNQYTITTDNKFISFDRTCNGFNAVDYERETLLRLLMTKKEYPNNPFLLFDRSCGGYTALDADSLPSKNSQYDIYADIPDNCLCFRVTDEGAVGYKLITKDCESDDEGHLSVMEGYSYDGIVKKGEWSNVNVRMRRISDKMCLYFYVNGKLKYVTDELPLINMRRLNENDTMCEGVAYNISLGGGTQGLMETIMPNYMLVNDEITPIEREFCGSFIGDVRVFRFFDCRMESLAVKHNSIYEENRLKID